MWSMLIRFLEFMLRGAIGSVVRGRVYYYLAVTNGLLTRTGCPSRITVWMGPAYPTEPLTSCWLPPYDAVLLFVVRLMALEFVLPLMFDILVFCSFDILFEFY